MKTGSRRPASCLFPHLTRSAPATQSLQVDYRADHNVSHDTAEAAEFAKLHPVWMIGKNRPRLMRRLTLRPAGRIANL